MRNNISYRAKGGFFYFAPEYDTRLNVLKDVVVERSLRGNPDERSHGSRNPGNHAPAGAGVLDPDAGKRQGSGHGTELRMASRNNSAPARTAQGKELVATCQ